LRALVLDFNGWSVRGFRQWAQSDGG
jgi:hypothetical protein